jgi:translation initiation factor 1
MEKAKSVRDLSDLHRLLPESDPATGGREETPRSTSGELVKSMVTLLLLFEKAGRKGSGVTVIRGFYHDREDLLSLAAKLKSMCGAGGAVKEDRIEIQGDHRDKISVFLKAEGFRVKVRK